MHPTNQNHSQRIRPMAVSGSFYPSDPTALKQMLSALYLPYSSQQKLKCINAVIVPHAGYVFSGSVAASAFAQINPETKYENIFLIGSSHQVHLNGASINIDFDDYATPLGNVSVNIELGKKLIASYPFFDCETKAHQKEHSLEVQLPFLKYYLHDMPPIIPIIIGTDSQDNILEIANALKPYFTEKNLFVISCDFSHYPSYADAYIADSRTEKAILTGNVNNLLKVIKENKRMFPGLATSACGYTAVEILLHLINHNAEIKIDHIKYINSGDSIYGDKHRVVGYHSFIFTRNKITNLFVLTDKEKKTLLQIARNAIDNKLNHTFQKKVPFNEITHTLRTQCGAFVTLHENGKLRGCVGRFNDNIPLYELIEEIAISAAIHDPRFYPIQASELNNIDIEISVLTPLKKISSIDEFDYGKQGIYIERDGRSGTFLPQVANEVTWTKEEFLGHCSQDKAGLGWNGWKNANLYTYEAIVFNEEDRS